MESSLISTDVASGKVRDRSYDGPRILVCLASYGTKNEAFLKRLIDEYRSMSYVCRIVVLSNVPRDLGDDVEVRVGLPDKNPWSLPFAHKQLFADRIENYDLFIYAEDDILITQRNIDAFLNASRSLPNNLVAGFMHAEHDQAGSLYFDPLLTHFHWDPASVQPFNDQTFACFTNEHSACFMLTQDQLRRAIQSGGFLVPPHEGRYDLLCSAATDPYTQCGFQKMVCVSQMEDFTVLHLPNNKYALHPYRESSIFQKQIQALLGLPNNGRPKRLLFTPETRVPHAKWSKDYYEPAREEMLRFVPANARNVLSIGVGWGATEGALAQKGVRVVGIPIDSVIGACAESNGVEVVYGSFQQAREQLNQEGFDCILLSNVLHLLPDPAGVLASFTELLRTGGSVVVGTPNFASLPVYWRRLKRDRQYRDLGNFEKIGLHSTDLGLIKKWFQRSGLTVSAMHRIPFERARTMARLKPLGRLLTAELVIAGRKER